MKLSNNDHPGTGEKSAAFEFRKDWRLICSKIADSDIFWITAVLLITFLAFSPALSYRQLILDDNFYLLNVLSVKNSFWRIFDPVLKLRTPLTSFSLYLDHLIWGGKHFIFGAHLTNILLHCGTGVLFYLLLRSFKWGTHTLTPSWAGMTALIFTLHPQRVESVAWLCERKDCLAMFLGAAALLLFWRALEKDKISWGSACCLLLSFLAKPMWLFFFVPAAALIWMKKRTFPLGFALKLLFPSLLLFLLFAAALVWNVVSNQGDASLFDKGTFLLKIETVLYNYGNYFLRTFLPGNLFPLYPYYDPAAAPRWMALIPVALLFTPFLMKQEEFRPAILFGVLPLLICFAALLLPVVGFVRVGNTDFADRYSYLPAFFLLGGSAFLLKINVPVKSAFGAWFPIMGVLYCGGMLYKTELYLPVWKNASGFLDRATAPAQPNVYAVIWKACYHYDKREYDQALKLCREKLQEKPGKPDRIAQGFKLSLQGLILFRQGKPAEGIRYLNTLYMSSFSHVISDFPVSFGEEVLTRGAEYHLKNFNDRKAAANLYMRCSFFFRNHDKVYELFYAGMQALMEENYAEAAKQFRAAHHHNPNFRHCLQNLRYAEAKLKEQKK